MNTANNLNQNSEGYSPSEKPHIVKAVIKKSKEMVNMKENNQATLENFEITKLNACRFVGKSVYARGGSGQIFGGLWGNSSEIFDTINNLKEYATDEIHNVGLMSWDKYDDEKKLMGYTVGRFMKADIPVPTDLDYFNLPDMLVAKGWVKGEFMDMIGNAERLTFDALNQQKKYIPAWDQPAFMAEVYTKDTIPTPGINSVLGFYVIFQEKND